MQDTGIITFSVCNVHQAEDSSSEMLTQGLLGMKAIILERRKWIKIKLENGLTCKVPCLSYPKIL